MRLKEICDYISRGTTPDYVDESPYKVMNQATFSKGWLDESNVRYTSKPSKDAQIKKGDLLMASTGGGVLGKVFFYDSEDDGFYADSHVSILRNSKRKNLMKYLYYFFSIRYEEINATMVKGSTNQTELQRNYLLAYELDIPSLSKQQCIVDYLDEKLAKIDGRIEVLEKQQRAYARLKKSVIHQAVTRGLNPNVALKDSGIEWIGMIPEHWEEMRVKDFCRIKSGDSVSQECLSDDYPFPVYGGNGIMGASMMFNNNGTYIVIGRVGAQCGNVRIVVGKSFVSDNALILRMRSKGIIMSFLYYMLTSCNLNRLNSSTAQPLITGTKVLNVTNFCPPLSEQQAIASYLDEKCAKIDAAIANIGKQIDASKRLKRALINEVITGKRNIE